MIKFPSIEQFRHCVREERNVASLENRDPAARKYRGTVKIHGTNAGVVWRPGEKLTFMSRNRILKVGDDNAGFAGHFTDPKNDYWLTLAMATIALHNDVEVGTSISVFGEWCGAGIQKGVAVSQLPKMFVIFATYADDRWLDVSSISGTSYQDGSIYGIHTFPTYEIDIDFKCPELAQNTMVEITEAVERECPVGKHFGVEGIGEGVVWAPAENNDSRFWFKVKGEKHSSSKVAVLAAVDIEIIKAKDDLVNALVTENRLNQALDHHLDEAKLSLEMRDVGHFLRWVFDDIAKEETDTIEASGFSVKDLGKPISDVAKRFFMKAQQLEMAA